jgi:uncharacterized protein YfaS (alpha-2-macroglobulin family)
MFVSLRAAIFAALLTLAAVPLAAADKPFERDELADAAIRLEGQVKNEARQAAKPLASLRQELELASRRNDQRTVAQALSRIAATEPNNAATWLRLARTLLQVRTQDESERSQLLERAAAAAYVAYQRTRNRNEEADSLVLIGRSFADRKLWRPALDAIRVALELREVPEVRATYETLRDEHGFRLLDYTVDSDSASPRACFQFSEELLSKRTDFAPFVSVAGMDKPALSADEKQLCVEGLKHGERYNVTVRSGLPSSVKEALRKSAEFTIYVRDRKPSVRFAGRAYVLPRSGQRGIPLVSVNTRAATIEILRIGDRNLTDTVLGSDFQRNLDRYDVERLRDRNAIKVWNGELALEQVLNADVTTAFPVDQAVGDIAPGVYVMVAEPAGPKSDDSDSLVTQWFIVSDLGLTAYSGSDGIHAFVHGLASAQAKDQIELRLLARSNEVLATRRTDAEGHVQFEAGLARGEGSSAPAMLIATDPRGDYAFLSLKAPAFDLTDRGVSGRPVPAGLDAFVYTERGVYRSGETVHVTSLLRDSQGYAAAGVPLTLVLERPDGVEYRRAVLADQGLGGRSLSVALVSSAPTGTWRVRAFIDLKRPPVGEASFMVEDYVADRLEFELASANAAIGRGAPANVTVAARYLYGAPAANLELEGEVIIAPAKQRANFPGYQFGLADEETVSERQELADLPETDAAGNARFPISLQKVPASTRPLEAQVAVRLAESGGRAVERKLTLPVTPTEPMIGVKPLFSGRSLGEGDTAGFEVIFVAPDGSVQARNGLRYELLKIESRYQWYRRDGRWEWEPIKQTRRVADGQLDVTRENPGRIALPVQLGRYRLEVSGSEAAGPTTSVTFDAGWYAEATADTPDMLEIALDKPEYRPGEVMTVAVTARTAGRVSLTAYSDRYLATTVQEVQPGTTQLQLNVGRDWGTGGYVVVTLRRPLDAAAQRMPGRAIGVKWFAIDRGARTLAMNMTLPQLLRPNSSLQIPIKVDGLTAGEEARVLVAAVDVGILNLTNYKPPAPDDYYLGQRRLTAEVRDLYGQLIDGMQGTRGQIRTGGDAGGTLQGSPPAQAPLALYSGIVTVGSDGAAQVNFDIPAFAGTVRVMGIAWSRDKVGRAVGDVAVRDPVVVTATLPRFMLSGDRASLNLDIDNVEGEGGEYRLAVRTDGPISIGNGASRTVTLRPKQREVLSLPLSAAGAGSGAVTVGLTGPNGFAAERSYVLITKPATQILARRTVRPIAKGESITLSNDVFADLVPGTGSIAVSIGLSTSLDAATLLKALDRYPFGCSEQITSRALPLLYVNELASEAHLALDGAVDQRVRDAIERLLARQDSNGSFGLWGIGGDDAWLDAYVMDFLTRARDRGFVISDTAYKLGLDRLRNLVGNAAEPTKEGGRNVAYALYVLARNGAAPLGDLRYIADAKLDELATPIAKAQIAAALATMGDRTRAERVYAAALSSIPQQPQLEAFGRVDYGSVLRDAAALVTLASEANAPRATLLGAVQRIEATRGQTSAPSTQENAWLVLAARALAKDAGRVLLDAGGEEVKGPLYRTLAARELAAPFRITNAGEEDLQAVVTVNGAPLRPEPAAERGFKIERLYHTLDGAPVNIANVKQNQRLAVVLKITETNPQFGRIIVADYLPAGFEIDNPRIVSSGDTGTLSWISDAAEPVNSEFRDDRFSAAFERKEKDPTVFTVAYVVRAVSPGRYTLPQAFVEDMYRPDRFGRTGTGTVEVTGVR